MRTVLDTWVFLAAGLDWTRVYVFLPFLISNVTASRPLDERGEGRTEAMNWYTPFLGTVNTLYSLIVKTITEVNLVKLHVARHAITRTF